MSDDTQKNTDDSGNAKINEVKNSENESFSKDYVKELREENKSWRIKSAEAEKKAKDVEEQFNTKVKELENTYSEKEKVANAKIILAELKALAISQGIVDLDGLKLLDKSNIKINENGDIEGAEDLINQFKEKKPYLFKKNENSTYTGKDSSNKKKENKKSLGAFDMTDEEFNKSLSNRSYLNK